ncbi:MAG: hypothetical protein AB1457_01590 [Chloroflexota bacterium]|nr:MAG: hypothetical protein KatS3mg047_0658 [Bellilinea sp.]
MNQSSFRKKSPVRQLLAERYLLISLISFAATVLIIRLFLELTNYPRVEFGTLHIAHVIWGGLILFAAALLPIMFANRWALFGSALLSGIGFGLFIDEIGKFITQNNDYFYPPAAPLIYASFLLTVLVYNQFRKPQPSTTREDLYHIFSMMEELLDEDLDEEEKSYLIQRLNHIINTSDDKTLIHLAHSLLNFLKSDLLTNPISPKSGLNYRLEQLVAKVERIFSQSRLHLLLIGGLFWHGFISIMGLLNLTFLSMQTIHGQPERFLEIIKTLPPNLPPEWLIVKSASQAVIGFFSLVAGILLIMKRDRLAIRIGVLVLTTSLTVVNLLVFYLDQFSASLNAIFEFALLLGLINYRRRFIQHEFMDDIAGKANHLKRDEEQILQA